MLITYEKEKLADAVIFFATKTRRCGITKLFKLLNYLDFIHFRETGRSVTRLSYDAWEKGPVPAKLWKSIKDGSYAFSDSVLFENITDDESLRVFTKILPRRKFDGKFLTKREKRIMDLLAEIYRDATADEMTEISHLPGEPWDKTRKTKGMFKKISYWLAIDDLDQESKEKITERVEEMREIRKALQ